MLAPIAPVENRLRAALLFMVEPMFTKLRRVRVNYLIQLKIRLGRVALVSA
jgi:hypothetical protein